MGRDVGKVISDTNEATSDFKGVKVPVEIDVDPKTKTFTITVFSPPMSELIKKDIGIEKGSGKSAEVKAGNIAIERIISIAKTKLPNLLAKDLKAAVKMAVGSCVSLGILVENKSAKETMEDIESGKYDQEIAEEKTEVSTEKKAEMDAFWTALKAKQEKEQKVLEEAKAAEEAAKAEAAAAAPAEGEAPEEGAAATPTPAEAANNKK